jgi:hypothetical protein
MKCGRIAAMLNDSATACLGKLLLDENKFKLIAVSSNIYTLVSQNLPSCRNNLTAG